MNNFISLDFNLIFTYILLATVALASVVVCAFSYKLLNAIPAKWLCDYDEVPDENVLGVRYNFKQSGIYTSALFAVLMMLIITIYGLTFYSAFVCAIAYVLFLIAMCDQKFTIIPDQFIVILAVLSIGFAVFDLFGDNKFIDSWLKIVAGCACGGLFLLVVNLLSILLFKKQGMGFGDVKLMAAVGCCIGFPTTLITLLLAVVIAFVYILFILIKSKLSGKENSHYFPFGPFLCASSVCTLMFIVPIYSGIDWYISLLTF